MTYQQTPMPGQGFPPPPPPKGGMPKWLIILLVVLLIVMLFCCGGLATCWYVVGKGTSAIGMQFGGALPASFPKDVPVYTGFKPTFSVAPPGTSEGVVTFSGSGDAAKIAEFYEKEMAAGGWKQTSSSGTGDGILQVYTKADQQVSITAQNNTLVIQYDKKTPAQQEPDEPVDNVPPAAAVTTPPVRSNPVTRTPEPRTPSAAATPGTAAKMPANFPTDLPIATGLAPTPVSFSNGTGNGMVVLSGKVDKAKTVASFDENLKKQGWKQEQNINLGENTMMVYTKEKRRAMLSLAPDADSGELRVTITYEQEQ